MQKVEDWRSRALGVAVVDQTSDRGLAIWHVSADAGGADLSGAWHFETPDPSVVAGLLSRWIVMGTRDGVRAVESLLAVDLATGDLAALVQEAERAEAQLQSEWAKYKDAEPRKRSNLVRLNAPTWPRITVDGDAAKILSSIDRLPFPEDTPELMQDVLALARLVEYVINSWADLEAERISRPYLKGDQHYPYVLPPAWLALNPPWGVAPVS